MHRRVERDRSLRARTHAQTHAHATTKCPILTQPGPITSPLLPTLGRTIMSNHDTQALPNKHRMHSLQRNGPKGQSAWTIPHRPKRLLLGSQAVWRIQLSVGTSSSFALLRQQSIRLLRPNCVATEVRLDLTKNTTLSSPTKSRRDDRSAPRPAQKLPTPVRDRRRRRHGSLDRFGTAQSTNPGSGRTRTAGGCSVRSFPGIR